MASKTDVTGREKVKVRYLVGGVEVKPVRVGQKRMEWRSEDGSIRVKTWETKELIKIGGKR